MSGLTIKLFSKIGIFRSDSTHVFLPFPSLKLNLIQTLSLILLLIKLCSHRHINQLLHLTWILKRSRPRCITTHLLHLLNSPIEPRLQCKHASLNPFFKPWKIMLCIRLPLLKWMYIIRNIFTKHIYLWLSITNKILRVLHLQVLHYFLYLLVYVLIHILTVVALEANVQTGWTWRWSWRLYEWWAPWLFVLC